MNVSMLIMMVEILFITVNVRKADILMIASRMLTIVANTLSKQR
jgi:hypothetical protein